MDRHWSSVPRRVLRFNMTFRTMNDASIMLNANVVDVKRCTLGRFKVLLSFTLSLFTSLLQLPFLPTFCNSRIQRKAKIKKCVQMVKVTSKLGNISQLKLPPADFWQYRRWPGQFRKACYVLQTSQELRMLSSVTINCQVTKIVMNSGSQLS